MAERHAQLIHHGLRLLLHALAHAHQHLLVAWRHLHW
jgi:hypothetical protein